MLQLRGDIHEGGGQILRTSLALAAATGQPFRLTHIRAGRSRPGLQAQHLAAVRLAQQLCGASVRGDRQGSGELVFEPGPASPGPFQVEIGTAGSMTLLLQACFWALATRSEASEVALGGGSDVAWSPPFDYLEQVTLPLYGRLARVHTLQLRRGFFPRGGGRWHFRVEPHPGGVPLEADLPQSWGPVEGKLVFSRGLSGRGFLERARRARSEVAWQAQAVESASEGVCLVLWCASEQISDLRLGASALSEKGKSLETMIDEAWQQLKRRREADAPLEEHLTDQVLPLLALLGGTIRTQHVTPHTRANLEVIQAFLGPVLQLQGSTIRADRPAGRAGVARGRAPA